MRWRSYLLVSLILLICCTHCYADIVISAGSNWTVANGHDSTTIIVNVTNFSGSPLEGVLVNFSLDNPLLGFLNQEKAITNKDGIANTVFRTKTVSGVVNITAEASGLDPAVVTVNIDHDTPFSMQFISYPNNATVGTIQNISVRMQDIHGNIVESRRNTEYITFTIITMDDSRLWNFSSASFTNKSTAIGNNQTGWIISNITLDTDPGDTLIRIKPQDNIPDRTIKIERVADGEPYFIRAVRRDPSVPFVPADGKEFFVITYELYDQYWNKLNNKVIELSADVSGEPWYPNITTTYEGIGASQYGPFPTGEPNKGKIFSTNLIATPQENRSIQSILPVEFYDPNPYDLILSVNPKNMPSLDVNSTSKAVVTGIVIDCRGRGVKGEKINFSIMPSTYSIANPKVTAGPYINNGSVISHEGENPLSAVTEDSGFAYITFIPGQFDENELRSVTGSCIINASWNGIKRNVVPIWKNYGYLKVTTWADSTDLTVDKEVNIGVEVYADGPSFTSIPIDMIFCTDRGASMLWDTFDTGEVGRDDKMRYLYNYSGVILEELVACPEEEQCDRAGVVSFGPGDKSTNWPDKWPGDDITAGDDTDYLEDYYPGPYTGYEDFATINTGLEYEFKPLVENEIGSLRPFGDPWKGDKQNVPLRYGLYKSINEMIGLEGTPPRPEAIRAIVVLTDPEWNDWGDPSAGWDGTSVAVANAVTKKAPWDLPQGGLSAWVPFTTFGKKIEGGLAVPENNVPVGDDRQNMANYAKEHDIIIYSIAYPKKNVNIEESRERVLRGLAESTGGMYFEARNGTSLEAIFETIGKDLRQRASVNTTADFNFTNVRLNADPVNLTPGYEVFDYVNSSQSTFTQKWNKSNIYYPGYPAHRNDTENWTNYQKLTFNLGTMYIGDRWMVNFTLRSKKVATVELFENSYIYSDDEELIVPKPIIAVGAYRYGDVPTSELEINYFNVTDSMNAVYTITYSGTDTVHARLYYRKTGDVQGDWKQFAARNYQCKDGECNGFTDEALMNKWLLGSGQYMFKIEAWATDAPLDDAYDGPKGIGKRFFIWLR